MALEDSSPMSMDLHGGTWIYWSLAISISLPFLERIDWQHEDQELVSEKFTSFQPDGRVSGKSQYHTSVFLVNPEALLNLLARHAIR